MISGGRLILNVSASARKVLILLASLVIAGRAWNSEFAAAMPVATQDFNDAAVVNPFMPAFAHYVQKFFSQDPHFIVAQKWGPFEARV